MASIIQIKARSARRSGSVNPDRRSEDRSFIAIWTHLRTRDRRTYPARITNISTGGLKLFTPAKLIDYAEIEVELPAIGWKYLLTVWHQGDEIGAEFEPTLAPDAVERVLSYNGKTN